MPGMTCIIDGCERPTFAKGLCTLHYTRQRRNGDPAIARRRGRKADPLAGPLADWVDQFFPNWSARTKATYVEAWKRFRAISAFCRDNDPDARFEKAVEAATRPNGTINVTKFNEISMSQAALAIARLEREANS